MYKMSVSNGYGNIQTGCGSVGSSGGSGLALSMQTIFRMSSKLGSAGASSENGGRCSRAGLTRRHVSQKTNAKA